MKDSCQIYDRKKTIRLLRNLKIRTFAPKYL